MLKIAVVNVGAHGHVNPTLPVVGELVARGARVTYFTTEEFGASVKAQGAEFHAFESLFAKQAPPSGLSPAAMLAAFPGRLIAEAEHTLPQLAGPLAAAEPDLIIYDRMAVAGRLLAKKLGVRTAQFCPSYASNEHFMMGQLFGVNEKGVQLDGPAEAAAERLARDYGGAPLNLRTLMGSTEGLNVVFMPRAFQYAGETFDERFAFVGPALAPRVDKGLWQPSDDGRPLVFVSLGTVFNDWPEFFNMGFEALAGSRWRVLMAVGKRVDKRALGPFPANIEVAEHVPQLDVLQHARLFVTHGGMNSTMESLFYGVPMVVIPQMIEQAATARRVQELGLGRALKREDVTVQALRDAIEAVADDTAVKARVLAMQDAVRSAGGQKRAAEAIIAYAGG